MKGGGREAGGGVATTRRERHIEPFAIRTMPRALIKLGDAISGWLREDLTSEGELTSGYTYPIILVLKEAFKHNMNNVFQFQNNEQVVVNIHRHHTSPYNLMFKTLMM